MIDSARLEEWALLLDLIGGMYTRVGRSQMWVNELWGVNYSILRVAILTTYAVFAASSPG